MGIGTLNTYIPLFFHIGLKLLPIFDVEYVRNAMLLTEPKSKNTNS